MRQELVSVIVPKYNAGRFLSASIDCITSYGKSRGEMMALGKYRRIITRFLHNHLSFLPVMSYNYPKTVAHYFAPEDSWENVFPTVIPQWDRSPRVGCMDGIYANATPENFRKHLTDAVNLVSNKQPDHRLIFLKSWNEWATWSLTKNTGINTWKPSKRPFYKQRFSS